MSGTQNKNMSTWLFASGIGLLLILAPASLGIGWQVQKTNEEIFQLNEVVSSNENLMLSLVGAQNGMRGYILTGNLNYLAAYFTERQKFREVIAAKREQLEKIMYGTTKLLDLAAEHEKNMEEGVNTYEVSGLDAAIEILKAHAQKKVLRTLDAAIQDENRIIIKNITAAKESLGFSSALYTIFSVLVLIVTAVVSFVQFYIFRKEIAAQMVTRSLLQAQGREIEMFSHLSETMHAAKSREESYKIIQSYGQSILQGVACVLYVYSHSRDQLRVAACWGDVDEALVPAHFLPDECWGLRRGRLYTGTAIEGQLNCQHHLHDRPRSYMCVPITAGGQTSGMLYVYADSLRPGALDGVTLQATAFADQLSQALVNLELRERLQHMATQDSLTGLYNRRVLDDMLIRDLARADRAQHKLSVLMLDIDHFKTLNDTYGHSVGDQVLKQVAGCLSVLARQTDTVCRYGGEEFLMVFPDCDAEQAAVTAEKIRQSVKALKLLTGNLGAPAITISIGIAIYPDHGRAKEDLVKAADNALYQAKRAGRDRVHLAEQSQTGTEHPEPLEAKAIPSSLPNGKDQAAV